MRSQDYFDFIMEDFLRGSGFYSTYATPDFDIGTRESGDNRNLLKAIKNDTIEYFSGAMKKDLSYALTRRTLTKEERDRVVGFMKERLRWYGENGFLLPSK
jgi:hypothetical protein